VEQFLKERGLILSPDMTRLTHIDEGFDFLGQNLRKYDGKALAKPSKKNTHGFLEKVRGIIDASKSVSQKVLVKLLNPVIRGWANYHRHIAAKDTFRRVDHEIWQRLWQWARRRHPKKSRDWVKRRYFPSSKRAWDFAFQTGEQTSEGKPVWRRLVYASDTKIRRHVKTEDRQPVRPTMEGLLKTCVLQEAGIPPASWVKPREGPAPLTQGQFRLEPDEGNSHVGSGGSGGNLSHPTTHFQEQGRLDYNIWRKLMRRGPVAYERFSPSF
jgi:hypothetical protein